MAQSRVFAIHTRLLADPPLWCAEIQDGATEQIVWSSWRDDWAAFQTVEEAKRRADEMLPHLVAH
jgi:hypothetical protein